MVHYKVVFTVFAFLLSERDFAQKTDRDISCKFLEEALNLSLICYFPEDVRATKTDFSVYHYQENKDAVRLVNCYWIRGKEDMDCDVKEGYEYDKITHTDHISILINNVSSNHLGRYECQLSGAQGSCYLSTIPIGTENLESLQAADGMSTGAKIGIGVGAGAGVLLTAVFLVLAYCWWRNKRTPKNENTNPEAQPLTANKDTSEDQNKSQGPGPFIRSSLEQEEPSSEQRRPSLAQNEETREDQNESQRTGTSRGPNLEQESSSEQRRKSTPQNDGTYDQQKKAHRRTNTDEEFPSGNTSSLPSNLGSILSPLKEGRDLQLHWEKNRKKERRDADGSFTTTVETESIYIISNQKDGWNTSDKQESQPVSCSVQDTNEKESINVTQEEKEATADLHSRDVDLNIRATLRQNESITVNQEEEGATPDLHSRDVDPNIRNPLRQKDRVNVNPKQEASAADLHSRNVDPNIRDTLRRKESITLNQEEEGATPDLHSRDVDPNIRDNFWQKDSHLSAAKKLTENKIEQQEDSLVTEDVQATENVKVRKKVKLQREAKTDC